MTHIETRNTFLEVRVAPDLYEDRRRRSCSCPPPVERLVVDDDVDKVYRKSISDIIGQPDTSTMCGTSSTSSKPNTTVMLRNIPIKYTNEMVLDFLESSGFSGKYDFIYLPVDYSRGSNVGYGFINFKSESSARRFMTAVDGVQLPLSGNSTKVCSCSWAYIQGFEANVSHVVGNPYEALGVKHNVIIFDSNGCRLPLSPCVRGNIQTFNNDEPFFNHRKLSPCGNSQKLFVGGIPIHVDERTLSRSILQHLPVGCNIVDCIIIRDSRTGIGRGFGFVTLDSPNSVFYLLNKCRTAQNGCSIALDGYKLSLRRHSR
ncbi:hypothetical protein FOL47_001286 [Perkinsus chesapeaki]|uniref:RRM domain-containing protein n=2 Tax=Alveolata TaxID=33630 RepID=A0A7J6N3F9_PERCH|nr:hypothetical protein FOL47_001286 [Perkinsus chesapeaki]